MELLDASVSRCEFHHGFEVNILVGREARHPMIVIVEMKSSGMIWCGRQVCKDRYSFTCKV